jgi:diguanylate cyclase (GGDEF)-like protein/PAS domain S-box-containing protein
MNRRGSCWSYGLRARILLPLVVIGLLLTTATALLVSRASARSCREHVAARAAAITHAICHLAETTADEGTLQRFVAAMAAEPQVKLVVVAAGDPPTVIASSRTDWLGLAVSQLPDSEHTSRDLSRAVQSRQARLEFQHDTEGTVDFTVPLRTRMRTSTPLRWASGSVMLHLDGRPLMHQQAQITRTVLITLELAVMLAALAAYCLLQLVVLRPIERIAEVAHLVAGGIRTARVQSTRRDELGALAADIDSMLDELVRREMVEAEAKREALAVQKRLESTLAELSCSNFALDQHAIVAVTDLSGVITYVNEKFCQISQYSREELIGSNHRIVNSGHHPKSFWVQMWRTVLRGQVWRNEVCNRAKDGTQYWVDTTIVPFSNRDGRVSKLVAIRSDITARKQTERALLESQERFDLAVRGSSDGIWDWIISTDEVHYSPRFKELLGYSDEEFPDRLDSFKSRLHPDDAPATWEAVQRHLDSDEPYDVTYRLLTKSGQWRWFRHKGAAIRDAEGVARRMAGSISDITALKSAEERLAQDARIDGLTGLPNRTLLLERLDLAIEQAKTSKLGYAVLFLDFDRFKLINDSLGHVAGDELLRQIACRLRTHVRSVDWISRASSGNTVARLGGDEFVVLLRELTRHEDAVDVGERLLSVLAAPYQLHGHEVYSTASIGIVVAHSSYDRAEDVLRDADTAMYEAKHSGKACQMLFDEAMRTRVTRRQQLESDLHRALASDELYLEYQPIAEISCGAIRSLEALCRWKHPVFGSISPAEFIPIAEESGLIVELGARVLRMACHQYATWRRELGPAAPPKLSLNLSRKQLREAGLPELVRQTLQEFELDPFLIELEVTEDMICTDLPTAAQMLQALKDLGVKVAIDDFGIGSSSFAALNRFPVDTLKVDRSLLSDFPGSQETAALIEGLVVIASGLGVQLVVEGVEHQEQVVALLKLGCTLAQGYHFGRPMPVDRVDPFLRERASLALQAHGSIPAVAI